MKLNFNYCKKCPEYSHFFNVESGFNFYCIKCGSFLFDVERYKREKFDDPIEIKNVKEEWEDIKKMNIIRYSKKMFYKCCPYYFEHLVDQDEA